ncbi:tyrosinase family protein [Pseudorhodoferax sp.]|uniref:tyrosinase family protein n=1 Tax=Pseudorhodoferax sp. TaxID=1993553 RepID=UPI0039E3F16D
MRPPPMHRRAALHRLGQIAALGAAPLALGGCEALLERIRNRPVRRSLRTLAANDPIVETYRAAVAAMKALPASDRRSWNAQAQIHFDHCPHGNWFFLPWHRAYLLYFEQICRELTGAQDFALPYWNWTCQRQIPAPFLGDAGNPLFAPGRSGVPPAALPDDAVGPGVMQDILDEPNFALFASSPAAALRPPVGYGPLEGTPHNSVHGFVGGVMNNFQSPRDPVFWMHHNMIERVWWEWNGVQGHANTDDPAWTGLSLAGMFADRHGALVQNVTVGAMNLAPLLSYRFDSDPFTSCPRRLRPLEIPDEAALRRLLQEGGHVELQRRRVLARTGALQVPVGAAASPVLEVADAPALAGASRAGRERLLLRVEPAEQPPSGEFFVRVYVDLPGAGPDTGTQVPQFAGSFAFFHDPQAHAAHQGHGAAAANAAFMVDLGATLQRLRAGGAALGGAVGVQLVAVPWTARADRTRTLQIRGLELLLADSLAPAPRPLGQGR